VDGVPEMKPRIEIGVEEQDLGPSEKPETQLAPGELYCFSQTISHLALPRAEALDTHD
jgi:hypothetical protein